MGSVTAAILCGGRSERMGTDKALLEIDGVPIIARIAQAVREVIDDIVLITPRPDAYAFLDLPHVSDTLPDAGPLSALHDALRAARGTHVLVVACDFPRLTPAVLRELLDHAHERPAVPLVDGRPQPLCAVYPVDCCGIVHHLLEHGERSVRALLRETHAEEIALSPELERALTNVNTPEDVARLESGS